MKGRRIYLMRHGETLYQRVGTEGAIGNGALTARGREQIANISLLFRAVDIDAIYSSPIERASETAKIIADEKRMKVEIVPDLREIMPDENAIRDKSLENIFLKIQSFFKDCESSWDERYLGGETFREVYERAGNFLESLTTMNDWKTVLVIAHGGFNNALLAHATGMTEGRIFNIEQDFGCVNIVDFVDERPFLRLANFTLYDQLKINLEEHSLDIILRLLKSHGMIGRD